MRDLLVQTVTLGMIGSFGANVFIFAYLVARRHFG